MKLGAGYRIRGKVIGLAKANRRVFHEIIRVRTFSGNEHFMPKQVTGASLQ